jgi:SAM-dependent methyltransferase
MPDVPAAALAAVIQELVRAHATSAPAPRALPYLGLEHASGTGFHLLDALAARGIFRKYEHVLDLGAGLGGTSRWLAARLGCEVVGTATSAAEAAAGSELTRRARLGAQVRLVPALAHALPFCDGRFTHVWILEVLPRLAQLERSLAEAVRVLRRGGTIAVQDLVATRAVSVPGWRFAGDATVALRAAGFVDLEVRDRTPEIEERSSQVVAARARLHARMRGESRLEAVLAEREALADALATGALRVVQILARRP